RLAVPTIADWCTVHVVEEDGALKELAVAHVDPEKIRWARELGCKAPPPDPNAPTGMYAVLRTGKPEIYADISDELLVATARNEEELRIMRLVGFSSVIVMPMRVGDKNVGVLQFVATESGRHYGDADVALAEELARLAAVAVDNARLYRQAEQARETAERAADRTARLQAVTAALAQVLNPAQAARVVIDQIIPAVNAWRGLVALTSEDGQTVDIIYATGYDPAVLAPWQQMPIEQTLPLTDIARTGQPFFADTQEKWLAAYPSMAASTISQSLAVLPLTIEQRTIGSMLISFKEQKPFTEDEQAYMMALAQQCAQGIDRARLYAERQAYAQTLEQRVMERTEQLQQALIEAQSADRIKSTMLATVSHEMRTPLSSIIGFSNLILGRKPDQQKLTEYTTFINLEARRLANLINDFLDLQRIESGREVFRFGDLDMADLVRDIVAKHTLDENNAHPIQAAINTVPLVRGDPNRIRQVILNLLSNALKFSPAGSEIGITLRREGSEVVFSIHDAGIGIPQEEQARLFQNFFRGDSAERNRIPGTGLGLALCRRIIDAHSGRIWAHSEGLNQGSTFSFALPTAHAAADEPTDHPHQQRGRNPIVVIEDDEHFSTYLTECLTPEGYTVQVVHFQDATPERLAQLEPLLILLDIFRGNEQEGWPLLAMLKQHPHVRNIPVIVCSILGDSGQAAELGASSYVPKPVDEDFLVKEIHRLVGAPPNRVLVVDDDEAIRTLIQDMMAESGYQTEVAVDGQDAIDRLKQGWPDLIILDLLMPNVDGFTVLEWIRVEQGNRDIPVIAFTAAELTPHEQQILKERASMVAVKSYTTPQQLLAIIKRTIQTAPAHQ
ncbi:MAG: response regulator, partial [Anaerolineae bacterium]|nr:response regulator [Anaerolineae bacterium]